MDSQKEFIFDAYYDGEWVSMDSQKDLKELLLQLREIFDNQRKRITALETALRGLKDAKP